MKSKGRVLLGIILAIKEIKMYFKWFYIFSAVFVLTSLVCGESIPASDLKAVDRQFQNGLNHVMDDSISVEKIAFYSERDGNSEIYMSNADGTGEVRLTVNNFEDFSPDLSPDGVHIIFVSNRDGNRKIYKMKTDGTDVIRLTNTSAEEVYPFWSADNSKIIFCSKRDGSNYEIYMMNPNGTGQTRITYTVVSEEWPHLSPDMSKIAYGAGNFPDYKVYRCNVNGSDVQEIAQGALPKWSRDGNKIAHNKLTYIDEIFEGDFYIINADGTEPRKITNSPQGTVSENPYWSPDGTRFAFQSNMTGNFQIYVIDTTGINQTRITNHTGNDYWPSWGVVRVPLKKYLGQTPPDSIPKRFPPSSLLSNGEWWWHGSPVFSPDGMEMYFVKYVSDKPSGNMEMYYMKIVNGEWTSPQRPSFASDSSNNSPVFTADGNRLLFTSMRDGSIKIYQVTRTESSWSAPELVNMDYASLPGSLGWFISLTVDEAIYFAIYTPPSNAMDIYKSELVNGQYSQFEKLPDQINSASKDATPYIAPDESYIIFMSNRPGGYGGYDLYISYKKPDGTWTTAKNMENKINSFSEEAMPLLSPEGKYLFFNSVKSEDLGFNAYWVDASFLCRSGDADNSGSIDISDVVYLINYLFKGGPAPELMLWGDCNNDDTVSISDVVYLINYIFKGGPKPCQ